MIRIAHRGNINGKEPELENDPDYLTGMFARGYDVECDIRYVDGKYYLGHDYPKYETNAEFLKNKHFWCHAKDGTTLRQALKDGLHCFFDNNPNASYTLTSKGYIWHWDGENLVYVMDKNGLVGVCSDWVGLL